jgi:2'-5' RNA ligase
VIRAFVALEIDEPTRDRFARLQAKLEPELPRGVRLVAPATLHVTLKFLGSIDEETAVPALAAVLEPLVPRLPRSARVRELGAFPRPAKASVVIASLDDPAGDAEYAAAVLDAAAEPLGVPRDGRAFHAHLTLARAKHPTDVRAALAKVPVPAEPAAFVAATLMKSVTAPTGPVYSPIVRFVLPALRS